jgi:hypothetical protein
VPKSYGLSDLHPTAQLGNQMTEHALTCSRAAHRKHDAVDYYAVHPEFCIVGPHRGTK